MAKVKRKDLLFSLFNEKIYGEAKANIEIVTSYFRANEKDNEVCKTLIRFIENNDYSEVGPAKISHELGKIDTLTDEDINNIVSNVKKFVKEKDESILRDYAERLRECCHSQAIINCQAEAGNDSQKYIELLQKFEYKSTYSEDIQVTNLTSIDPEKALADSFSKFSDTSLDFVKRAYPSVEGWLSAQMIMVVGRPGGGKSLFMQRTALELCRAGKRGYYVALGDLTPASFIIRMGAMALGIPMTTSARRSIACMDALKKEIEDRLYISCVNAGKIGVERLIKKIKSMKDKIDFVMIDYDANFKPKGSDSLYIEGGGIYTDLSELTIVMKKLTFVGCQPKQIWWDKSVLPMSSGGESSRKQQFIDGMITIGVRGTSSLPLGYLNFAKNRNGKEKIHTPYIRTSDGEFHEVPINVYNTLKDYKDKDEISWYELQQIIEKSDGAKAFKGNSEFTQGVSADNEFFVADQDPDNPPVLKEGDDGVPY